MIEGHLVSRTTCLYPNFSFSPRLKSGALSIFPLVPKSPCPPLLFGHWIAEINLFLGVWQGSRENRTGYWLRWWDDKGEVLLWGLELGAKERQRAERLAAQLKALGIEPEAILFG